jgi:hypothetical protein
LARRRTEPDGADQVGHLHSLQELATLIIKAKGLHSGLYDLTFQLNWIIGNIGPTPQERLPGAMVGIKGAGLRLVDERGSFTVDAAEVNPAPSGASNIPASVSPVKRSRKQ